MDNKPKPNLNLDKEYLAKVEGLIAKKDELEEIHFEYLSEVLNALGLSENIYESYLLEKDEEKVKKVVDESFEKLNSSIPEDILSKVYRLWNYLAESDTLEPADLIYVFGGISQLAVLEAIRLKKEDFAPRILFSGKKASYMKDIEMSEAEQYRSLAIEHGVSEGDILIEKESVNTPENIVNSAKFLHSIGFLPKKVIAVSLPYHMRRASLTMRSGFDWEFKLIRHPGKSAKYARDTYYKDKNGWSYIFFEYLKLYGARKMGHF